MLKNHIHLVWELACRDLRARYIGSSLGILWAFMQPVLQLLLFTFVFSNIFRISLAGERGGDSFPLFLFAGLLPWMGLSEMLGRSTTIMVEQSALIKKLAFPPHLLVLGGLVSAIIHQALATVVFLAVLAFTGHLAWTGLFLPVLMVLQVLLAAGACFFLAALQVFFRDTAQLVGYGLMVLFYGTPIIYPSSMINDPLVLSVMEWNPCARLVEAFRDVLLRGTPPQGADLAFLLAWGVATGVCGTIIFHRWRPQFADLL